MDKDKQIEEMANDLAKICPDLVENCCGQVNCVTHLTLSLSKIGYRKSSEVAREIIDEIECTARAVLIILKLERDEAIRNIKTECYADLLGYLAELKKKYTVEL